MMRLTRTVLALAAVGGLMGASARAEDKEVSLKGKLMCAKCELKEATKCQTVIQVKEGDKEVTYWLLDKGSAEDYHEAVCGSGKKDGTVTGKVSEKDGKKWITPTKVVYAEKSKAAVTAPSWLGSYASAREQGQKDKKPLAVFMASGEAGWDKLSRDKKLTDDVQQLLADKYVCVYLDTETAEGKRLASAFEIKSGLGVVLSDRTCEVQAFRHEGNLGSGDLARYLERYADPQRVARTTDTNPDAHANHAGAASSASGSCPNCQPAVTGITGFAPAAPVSGGSCCRGR